MDRLTEINQRLNEIWEESKTLRQESQKLLLSGLDLPGKYIKSKIYNKYIHVSEAWMDGNDRLIIRGETYTSGFFEEDDDRYFSWDFIGQTIESFRDPDYFLDNWEFIEESEFRGTLETCLNNLRNDIRRASEN